MRERFSWPLDMEVFGVSAEDAEDKGETGFNENVGGDKKESCMGSNDEIGDSSGKQDGPDSISNEVGMAGRSRERTIGGGASFPVAF